MPVTSHTGNRFAVLGLESLRQDEAARKPSPLDQISGFEPQQDLTTRKVSPLDDRSRRLSDPPSYRRTFQEFWTERNGWSPATVSLAHVEPQPVCPICEGTSPARVYGTQATTKVVGEIALLPKLSEAMAHSVARKTLNDEGFAHPCVVLDRSPCGHLAFCGQLTAFSGNVHGSLLKKYERAGDAHQANMYWQYARIGHSRADNSYQTNSLVPLNTGTDMSKPSYLNLRAGFWIEWNYLTSFKRNACRLDSVSLGHARNAYAVAMKHRERHGDVSAKRLASKSPQRNGQLPSPPRSPTLTSSAPWSQGSWRKPNPLTPPASPPRLNVFAASFAPQPSPALSVFAAPFTPGAALQQRPNGTENYIPPQRR